MPDLFDFKYAIINPTTKGSFVEQVNNCMKYLSKIACGLTESERIIRSNWFYSSKDESVCGEIEDLVSTGMKSIDLHDIPFTIVSESPNNGFSVQLAICIIENMPEEMIAENNTLGNISYSSFILGSQKWIFTGDGRCREKELSVSESAHSTFADIHEVLRRENISFKNLVRQWNYIPGIVDTRQSGEGEVQNYQEFNDARAEWYRKDGLLEDFPAATGIGVSGGAVKIEIIAFSECNDTQVLSLKNPIQSDAHQYSVDKLVGRNVKETPRFERGKLIFSRGKGHIWVSGTAAIRGEDSIPGDVMEQSILTCENIDALIQPGNLIKSGLPESEYNISPIYIRAYVKDNNHGDLVQSFLMNRYPDTPIHVLQADVCREELLVEVEGEFSLKESAPNQD